MLDIRRAGAQHLSKKDMQNKTDKRIRLKKKIRAKIVGTATRPRLTIFAPINLSMRRLLTTLQAKL